MSENLDALAKAKARALKRELEQQQADARLRQENARIRRLEKELATRRATILGETIRDADISRDERAMLGRILARRKDRPKDWSKIGDFMPGSPSPAPHDDPIEFGPPRPKVANG